jgi:hypothetical protein
MDVTREQQSYARLAGVMFLLKYLLEGFGDGVTIIGRSGETFAEIARFAAQSEVLWRFALLNVAAWIAIGVLAFAPYAVLEPVDKRLAQLAPAVLPLLGLLALGEIATLVWLLAWGAREPRPSALRPAIL